MKRSIWTSSASSYVTRNGRLFVAIAVAIFLISALATTVFRGPVIAGALTSHGVCSWEVGCATQATWRTRVGLGLVLRPISETTESMGVVGEGIVVAIAKGLAAQAGIRRGDVLLAVNGVAVETFRDARTALARPKDSATLAVKRGGQPLTFQIRLS